MTVTVLEGARRVSGQDAYSMALLARLDDVDFQVFEVHASGPWIRSSVGLTEQSPARVWAAVAAAAVATISDAIPEWEATGIVPLANRSTAFTLTVDLREVKRLHTSSETLVDATEGAVVGVIGL